MIARSSSGRRRKRDNSPCDQARANQRRISQYRRCVPEKFVRQRRRHRVQMQDRSRRVGPMGVATTSCKIWAERTDDDDLVLKKSAVAIIEPPRFPRRTPPRACAADTRPAREKRKSKARKSVGTSADRPIFSRRSGRERSINGFSWNRRLTRQLALGHRITCRAHDPVNRIRPKVYITHPCPVPPVEGSRSNSGPRDTLDA